MSSVLLCLPACPGFGSRPFNSLKWLHSGASPLRLHCQVPIFPPLQSAADFDEAACVVLVRAASGDPMADVSIAGVRTWTMSAQVAERFQVRVHLR